MNYLNEGLYVGELHGGGGGGGGGILNGTLLLALAASLSGWPLRPQPGLLKPQMTTIITVIRSSCRGELVLKNTKLSACLARRQALLLHEKLPVA